MPLLQQALDASSEGRSFSLSGLTPPATAYLASRLRSLGPLMLVAPDPAAAALLASDLAFFRPGGAVRLLLPGESSPFERSLPDTDAAVARLLALHTLGTGSGAVVAAAAALLSPVPPPAVMKSFPFTLRTGDIIERDPLTARLAELGYRRTGAVQEPGDLAVRGGIVDVFPPLGEGPLRVELWDDRIQSLRSFDPATQRSTGRMDAALVLPVAEFPRGPSGIARGREILTLFLGSRGIPLRDREALLSLWEAEGSFPGMAAFLPLLHGEASYPLDHAPSGLPLLVLEPEAVALALSSWEKAARARAAPDLPDPAGTYASAAAVGSALSSRPQLAVRLFDRERAARIVCRSPLGVAPLPSTVPQPAASRPDRLADLAGVLAGTPPPRLVVAARSSSAAGRLQGLLADLGISLPLLSPGEAFAFRGPSLTVGDLSAGFALPDEGVSFVAESDIFGVPRETRRIRRGAMGPDWRLPIGVLAEGDIVVHVDHGIARYLGMKQLSPAGEIGDFLHLAFEGGDALYVPVEDLARVQPYRSASPTPPPLSRLGGAAWKTVKTRLRRALRLMAEELLRVQAERRSRPGHAFPAPDRLFREFEASFPWSETTDQEKAIAEVLSDMQAPRPMDRLVCGDVGFGKTEVALRAAFLAVEGGKQVAVLVPTTVLAQQHEQTFRSRLQNFPVRTAVLSRFVTPREARKTLGEMAEGKVDIVIGTHRLLSPDVALRDLGLLVIDEEHRFGVRHKEKLKKLKATVDVLTLSATPIPRTLFSAMSGLRDLSRIETPPADRKAIHTEVRWFETELIRDAVARELDRGGQVFIVHDRVQSIEAFRAMVARLVPHARTATAHGQMGERDLEEVMVRFLRREVDVLVCTTIIESGLDIAAANTLIVNRADRLGLAQLYQIRGRVGRSSVPAYAYLLVPPGGAVTETARKRLLALRELSELGSGFALATYDLELRGAGNLLGEEQSGEVAAVGLDLYTQLLDQALREAAGQAPAMTVEPALSLDLPAFLPEDYLPQIGERLTFYKRIASASAPGELAALREEAADRFGRIPPEAEGLFLRRELALLARGLGVERVDRAGPFFLVAFHPQARISPDALVGMLTRDRRVRFLPPATLRLDVSTLEQEDRVAFLGETLRSLGQSARQDG